MPRYLLCLILAATLTACGTDDAADEPDVVVTDPARTPAPPVAGPLSEQVRVDEVRLTPTALEGSVQNTAAQTVFDVTVYVALYGPDSTLVDTLAARVDPLEPGDSAFFTLPLPEGAPVAGYRVLRVTFDT